MTTNDFVHGFGMAFDNGERIVEMKPMDRWVKVTFAQRVTVHREVRLVNGTTVIEPDVEWQERVEYVPYADEDRMAALRERAARGL